MHLTSTRLWRLLGFEVRALWRASIPSRTARIAVLLLTVTWIVAATYGLTIAARSRPVMFTSDAIVTLLSLFLGTSLVVAMSASSRFLERPDLGVLWRLSPVPPTYAVLLPFGAIGLVSSVATAAMGLPFWLAGASAQFEQVAMLTVTALLLASWATIAAMFVLATVGIRKGTTAAGNLGRMLTTPLVLGTVVAMRWTTAHRGEFDGPMLLIMLVTSTALLPAAFKATANAWLKGLSGGNEVRASQPPRWGSPMWARMLVRTPLPWAVGGMLPVALMAGARQRPFLAVLVVTLPIAAMFHLVKWEDDCPARLGLAPNAGAVRKSLWLSVGAPAAAIGTFIAAIFVADKPTQLMALSAAIWSGPLLFFVPSARLRTGLQLVTMTVGVLLALAL